MTYRDPTDWDRLTMKLECPFCGAQPGYWCIAVKSGNTAQWLHAARSKVLREARTDGWLAKEHYIALSIARANDPSEPEIERRRSREWIARIPQIHAEHDDCTICIEQAQIST